MQTAHNKIIYHFKRVMSIILRILQDKYLCFTKIFDRTAFKKQFLFLKGNKMKTSDFYYDLPKELIAQTPLEPRDSSRLLVLDREKQTLEHKHFYDIIDYLNEGDLLVANDSRVLPARIYGIKDETGAKVEFLLLKQVANNRWETLCKPGKKARVGTKFSFGNGILRATVVDVKNDGNRIVDFDCEENFFTTLDKIGQMPLPPYITAELKDKERYQTVYSHELGSAAAPTAGLHFTTELMDRIKAKGVKIAYVTLHVGLGTFRPVKVDDVTKHKMHSEHYEVPEETAKLINETKKNGGRVIAVGTTSCRTLESVAAMYREIKPCEGFTDIFIYPGFEFKVLDGLITNFHLPESTLIMLVSAFAGYDFIMNAYKEAVKEKYRFFSFGDAMFIS
jgi:S-adenosylmethionine:tRNA ribosyltransferase-isomerase